MRQLFKYWSYNMLIVGITGRSGSGKSTVSQYYLEKGYSVADCDEIARQITEVGSPCLKQLAKTFGEEIIFADGSLNRALLAQRAFATPQQNALLIGITHPAITKELLRQAKDAEGNGAKLFFADGALIVGEDFEKYCDKIIVVTSDVKLSVSRIILRDGISKNAAYARLNAQKSEQELLAAADYVITNNASSSALLEEAEVTLQDLLRLFG